MNDVRPTTDRVRVLVVDDSPQSLYGTSRMLRAAGFDIAEASTGMETLELCHRDPPDVLILDVHLPDLHGFEICRRLRASPFTERLPVIHLSATYLQDEDRVRGLDAGADGYLTHPVEPVVLIATINAVLRARRAEQTARRREAELRAVFELAPSGICLLDRRLVFREVNPALLSMLDRTSLDLVGRPCTDGLVEGDRAGLEAWVTAGEHDDPWRGSLTYRKPSGGLVQLDWTVSEYTVFDTLLAVVSDVSERLRIEQDRERLLASERAARSDAERANRMKDEFLATLSHELRTPLNAIVGWTHVLQSSGSNPQELRKGLTIIERNARLQAQLISDLLDVSRIISGKLKLELGHVALDEMVEAALEGVRSAAVQKKIRIDLELAGGLPVLRGDAGRLQQVVWNLVHNAIKFTPEGGLVRVALRKHGNEVAIEVADDGIGIGSEFLPHIFERFRQEDAGLTRSHGGLGLGLAIVKQLVELHRGRVTAESEGLGLGSKFTVWLPLDAAREDEAAMRDDRARAMLEGHRILVVDDDPDARSIVRRLLTERGAEVKEAADVRRAMAIFERYEPELLISDIGMPLQDGYELIRMVRSSGRALPAIALTAFARPEDARRALEQGFQVHLPKPIDPNALLRAIQRLLAPSESASEHGDELASRAENGTASAPNA